ncbi:DUF1934 domain-containing protein [Sinanaerobacter sp. ZZT-01]|uniref:DUF1934 domain-containing protein n=1 Tax=Sinanaerobacter sp. ZZT-01 TaxID=3111540 RepID=UPI002D78C0F1|nr:DUF1934 domain-containing protein [Sinanaerobacter sp. ZZT-01]WRR94864.1 DUF1934 domain-containing protein [Sinanaerobacter sp. ZZT-01]
MLKIIGKQITSEQEENVLEFITEGKFYRKGSSVYLLYKESEVSGMEGCTTSLKVKGDTVKMRRYGESVPLDTVIEFEKGKRFEGYYDTPFGAVEMEVLTNEVENCLQGDLGKGTLKIDYHISLRGLTEGRSKLDIEII